MTTHFLTLERKRFKRSANFKTAIFVKIIRFLFVLYFGGAVILIGSMAFYGIKKEFPGLDPLVVINNWLIFWFLASLIFRFFSQQLPVIDIKPLMVIPIKKNKVIHYLLRKTFLSVFNFLPLFFFLPFAVVLLVNHYPPTQVILWFISMLFIVLTVNLINFLINKNNLFFYLLLVILAGFVGLEYFGIFKISTPVGIAFNALYNQSYLIIIPILLFLTIYKTNFRMLKKAFYIDEIVATDEKVKQATPLNLSWINRFGTMAPFLKNDIKLIWRNVRPRKVLFGAFIFLLYGILFYTQKSYENRTVMLILIAMFITGGFLMSFGQMVPAWDSEYYKLLMSQNIPYKQYLESKWTLMATSVVVLFILSTPYLYFGSSIFETIAVGALFNIGVNSFIGLFIGAYNQNPIELNVKKFGNAGKFNLTQLLMAIPKILIPIGVFYLPYKLLGLQAGLLSLSLTGVLGIIFKNFLLKQIEKTYQKRKYQTIAAFGEK